MIEVMSQWLQKIILLVLIATFLDMLLPNSSMQRYVKFVMGLLILLSIISPIMQLFEKDLSLDKLAVRILSMNTGESAKEWEEIRRYGEKLIKENDKEAVSFVQSQMESLIKAKVEEDYSITVSSVKVNITEEKDKQQAYPVISSVQLILDKDIQGTGQREQGGERKIEPIEPVTINVSGESSQQAPVASTSPDLSLSERKLLNDIANDVALTWSIDRTQVIAILDQKSEEG